VQKSVRSSLSKLKSNKLFHLTIQLANVTCSGITPDQSVAALFPGHIRIVIGLKPLIVFHRYDW